MKVQLSIVFMAFLVAASGCASSGSSVDSNQNKRLESTHSLEDDRHGGAIVDEYEYGFELSDYLRRVPGVLVRGSGTNISVNVRGISSFCYQKVNMLVFRKLVMHGKWKIRMHVFESESGFQVRYFVGVFKDGFSVIHAVTVTG